jgi:hypothetical protein
MLDGLDAPVSVLAVWEPLSAGQPPPLPDVAARLHDPRVVQLWDPELVVSDALREAERAHPGAIPQARLRTGESDDGILYDTVALFPAGERSSDDKRGLPSPAYLDGGLAAVLPAVRDWLVAARP